LVKDLVLFIAKGCELLFIVDSLWLHQLVMSKDMFSNAKQLVKEHIPSLISKTIEM
jgi:rRNA maturation protein Rpf1